MLDPSILREYDIRGVLGKTLSSRDAYLVGLGFGTLVLRSGGRIVSTAYDGRLSSPELEHSLVQGLLETGADVYRLGLGPTPMLYHAVHTSEADAGVMVTGSHNPPEYNGFKFTLRGQAFFGKSITSLGQVIADRSFCDGKGEVMEKPHVEEYVNALVTAYNGRKDLCVVWDAGNGAAGDSISALVRSIPGRHIVLNESIDGTFPAHHPDPTVVENLNQLREKVLQEEADLGVAFDGDGDRIGVVDNTARVLWGDQILAVLARDVLSENPGSTVIADVKSSQMLFDEVSRLGGRPMMWQTGHSRIKSKMLETGALLAGEMSGHIFFADHNYGYDDALYAAVRLINFVSARSGPLSNLLDSLPALYNTPEIRFPCPDERKFDVIDEVRERLEKITSDLVTIDGVRVTEQGGWWLLRASNTQPVLVARIEAEDSSTLSILCANLVDQLMASGIAVPEDLTGLSVTDTPC